MKFIPRKDRVIVEPIDTKIAKTKSGLWIPNMAQEDQPHLEGTVIAKGEEIHEDLKIGDRIAHINGAGTPITIDEKEHTLLRDQDVMMIIRDE